MENLDPNAVDSEGIQINDTGESENMEQEQTPEAVEYSLTLQLDKVIKERDEYLAMAQRIQADFENYRRRNKSVYADAFEDGAVAFIKTLLPVLDNLERALSSQSTDEALKTGVEMVSRQLHDVLDRRGVIEIDCLGKKFDPNLSEAIAQGTIAEGEPGTVYAILQKGYRLGNAVLRHAMVKVVAE